MPDTGTKIQMFPPGALRRIVVLGFGQLTVAIADYALRRNLAFEVFTGPRQRDVSFPSGGTVHDALARRGITARIVENLRSVADGPYATADDHTLLFSVGSPFIIRKDLIDLYRGRVINAHGAPLPRWRGAAGITWRMLAGDSSGRVCFHLVEPGIDDGDIVHREDYVFPDELRMPRDFERYAVERDMAAIEGFLDQILRGESLTREPQDPAAATYTPRLHTQSQAYIDWRWTAAEIETFVRAFSYPYAGARTFCSEEQVVIFDLQHYQTQDMAHPFFAGLIFRIHDNVVHVASTGGALAIPLTAIDSPAALCVGDRLWTPYDRLDVARQFRPVYTAAGLKSAPKA
jgi:methionyl-tRNA formyltransferase